MELAELATFINVVSAPLEHARHTRPLADVLEAAAAAAATAAAAAAAAGGPAGSAATPRGAALVPSVAMTRASLRALCDVLLSDHCSKAIFEMVNTVIARLAVVPVNRDVLTDLVADVVHDLGTQSRGRLDALLAALVAAQAKKLPAAAGKVSAGAAARPSANQLPLSEAGGRQHEHLLRALQTLDSVAVTTKRRLVT